MNGLAPTALGLKGVFFFAVIVLSYLAAPYLNLFFLLLGFLCVLSGLAVPWTWANLRGVRAEITDLRPTPDGIGAEAIVCIHAQRRRFAITPIVRISRRWRLLDTLAVVEPGSHTHRMRLAPLPRGVHSIEGWALESSFPVGVLRRRNSITGPTELIVHPTPADLPKARRGRALVAALNGDLTTSQGAVEPQGLRPWRDGDELRSVHWRATARSQNLVVVERESTADAGFDIILDRRAAPDRFEGALSLLTALAFRAEEDKGLLTLRTQEFQQTFGSGHGGWRELLRWLALATPLPMDAGAPPSGAASALRLPLQGHAHV